MYLWESKVDGNHLNHVNGKISFFTARKSQAYKMRQEKLALLAKPRPTARNHNAGSGRKYCKLQYRSAAAGCRGECRRRKVTMKVVGEERVSERERECREEERKRGAERERMKDEGKEWERKEIISREELRMLARGEEDGNMKINSRERTGEGKTRYGKKQK